LESISFIPINREMQVHCKTFHNVSKTILEYLYPWLQRLNEARPPRPGYATMGYFVERLNRKDKKLRHKKVSDLVL